MEADAAQTARRKSPDWPGELKPPAPMESDKTLQHDGINKSLSQACAEETNEEKCPKRKSEEPNTLPVEADPNNKGSMSIQEQEQEQEQEKQEEDHGRERLKRHRREVAGRVWIPEIWGHEGFLKDWADCSAFDARLVHTRIASARAALIEEGRRANSTGLQVINR